MRHALNCQSRAGGNGVPCPEQGGGANAAFSRGQGLRRLSPRAGRDVARCAHAYLRLLLATQPLAFRSLARTRRRPFPVHAANDQYAHAAVATGQVPRGLRAFVPGPLQVVSFSKATSTSMPWCGMWSGMPISWGQSAVRRLSSALASWLMVFLSWVVSRSMRSSAVWTPLWPR